MKNSLILLTNIIAFGNIEFEYVSFFKRLLEIIYAMLSYAAQLLIRLLKTIPLCITLS